MRFSNLGEVNVPADELPPGYSQMPLDLGVAARKDVPAVSEDSPLPRWRF